jgi:hypothetical protein
MRFVSVVALKPSVRVSVSRSVARHNAVEDEVLMVERVVPSRITQIQLGREVVARDEPVRAALPDQVDRGRDARDQIPATVVIVEQDVVGRSVIGARSGSCSFWGSYVGDGAPN